MFCKHCGKEIADDSKFCAFCGTNIEEKASEPVTPTVNVGLKVDPKNEARDSAARNILTLGICSLAFSICLIVNCSAISASFAAIAS